MDYTIIHKLPTSCKVIFCLLCAHEYLQKLRSLISLYDESIKNDPNASVVYIDHRGVFDSDCTRITNEIVRCLEIFNVYHNDLTPILNLKVSNQSTIDFHNLQDSYWKNLFLARDSALGTVRGEQFYKIDKLSNISAFAIQQLNQLSILKVHGSLKE